MNADVRCEPDANIQATDLAFDLIFKQADRKNSQNLANATTSMQNQSSMPSGRRAVPVSSRTRAPRSSPWTVH
jgi:hypothetical protein